MFDLFTELQGKMKKLVSNGHEKADEIRIKATQLEKDVREHVETGVGNAKDIFDNAKAYVDSLHTSKGDEK